MRFGAAICDSLDKMHSFESWKWIIGLVESVPEPVFLCQPFDKEMIYTAKEHDFSQNKSDLSDRRQGNAVPFDHGR